MDGTIVVTIAGGAVSFIGVCGTLLWRMGSKVGKLEGKLNGLNAEAFGRVEQKVDGMDTRMHSYEIQLDGFDKRVNRLDTRINGFIDVVKTRRKAKAAK